MQSYLIVFNSLISQLSKLHPVSARFDLELGGSLGKKRILWWFPGEGSVLARRLGWVWILGTRPGSPSDVLLCLCFLICPRGGLVYVPPDSIRASDPVNAGVWASVQGSRMQPRVCSGPPPRQAPRAWHSAAYGRRSIDGMEWAWVEYHAAITMLSEPLLAGKQTVVDRLLSQILIANMF